MEEEEAGSPGFGLGFRLPGWASSGLTSSAIGKPTTWKSHGAQQHRHGPPKRVLGRSLPDGRLVSGQIDLWFTASDGETILVDYKTGQPSDDALQLNLYALAIPVPVHHAYLYFLRPNRAVEVPLDPAAARAKVEELYQAQSRLDFPLHEGPHCHHCPYFRGLCPAR